MSINISQHDDKQWDLKSLKAFERDIIRHHAARPLQFGVGARVYFGVKCTVSSPDGAQREIDESLFITVLDENDNPPQAQFDGTNIDVRIKEGIPLKVSLKIFLNLNYHLKTIFKTIKLFA